MSKTKSEPRIRILGVMTGTSCDGLDASCIEIGPTGWSPLWSESTSYPKGLRDEVLELQKSDTRAPIQKWLGLHAELGNWYGKTLKKWITQHSPQPDVIANHGQTLAHFPLMGKRSGTLQLGDPTRIAHATGLTVVSHFRDGDLAAGGQGAPLVPAFHRLLSHFLSDDDEGISIHNIGGISNLTYIGPSKNHERSLLAFDTGPGNIWIDAAAEIASQGKLKMDREGRLALKGNIDIPAVKKILKHPYFLKKAPKSTGRDDFPLSYFLSKVSARNESLVATATAITVESIGRAYEDAIFKKKLPLSKIFICGGGAKNPVLLNWLSDRLPKVEFLELTHSGLDPQLIESQAFAYFGFLSLLGQPLGGNWTGAKGFGPPGQITPGKNWIEVLGLMQKMALL